MTERTEHSIDIKRGNEVVKNVPILSTSVRRFRLMQEDYVKLNFELEEAVFFEIGDYIDDEIFGRFVITAEQMPQYDHARGVYKYELTFNAPYMMLANRLFMLTYNGERKEASWELTSNLKENVEEVVKNVAALGDNNFTYSIVYADVPKANEIINQSYNSISILDAIKQIANSWECEYWFTKESDGNYVLNFGKCEVEEESGSQQIIYISGEYKVPVVVKKGVRVVATLSGGSKQYAIIEVNGMSSFDVTIRQLSRTKYIYSEYAFVDEILDGNRISLIDDTTIYHGELRGVKVPKGCNYILIQNEGGLGHYIRTRTKMELSIFDNHVQSSSVTNNRSRFANKVYVYGSAMNLPASYRKIVDFSATKKFDNGYQGRASFVCSKKIESSMFKENRTCKLRTPSVLGLVEATKSNIFTTQSTTKIHEAETQLDGTTLKAGKYKVTHNGISFGDTLVKFCNSSTHNYTLEIELHVVYRRDNQSHKILALKQTINTEDGGDNIVRTNTGVEYLKINGGAFEKNANCTGEITLPYTSPISVYMCTKITCEQMADTTQITSPVIDANSIILSTADNAPSRPVLCEFSDKEYYVKFNPNGKNKRDDSGSLDELFHEFIFCTMSGDYAYPPTEFSVNTSTIIIKDDTSAVPSALYSQDYTSADSIARVGSNRLQLPKSYGGYLLSSNVTDESKAVESAVCFEKVYPRCVLAVKEVSHVEKVDYTEYQGEDVTSERKWKEYTIKLGLLDESTGEVEDFDYRYEWQLSDTKLQIKFLSPYDLNCSPDSYMDITKLAGLTFDVCYNDGEGSFTIVKNTNYGTELPNKVLMPEIGSPCILLNWNAKALASLGLIDKAEEELLKKGKEYMDAIEEGQFTFECTMYASYLFNLSQLNQYTNYTLPKEGTNVTINNEAIVGGSKKSRIIGFEYKLDKPYDSPRFTIGETEAYSRLAKIEKEISQLS